MRSYLRIHSPWSQLAVFIILLGGAFIFAGLLTEIIFLMKGVVIKSPKDINYNDIKLVGTLKLLQGISSVIIFLLPALAFALITFRFKQFYFLGFRKQEKISFLFLAALIVIFSFPLVAWLGELNEHIPLTKWMIDSENEAGKQMQAFLKKNNSSDILIDILLVALLPAICEEVFFRGCLQRILIYAFRNPWIGITVTAALFSAFHFQFAGFFPRMFLGVILGALFWYSNSLWPSIIAHFVFNAVQVVVVEYFNPDMVNKNPVVPVYLVLMSGCIVFGILYFMKKQTTVTYAKVYEMESVNEQNQFIV